MLSRCSRFPESINCCRSFNSASVGSAASLVPPPAFALASIMELKSTVDLGRNETSLNGEGNKIFNAVETTNYTVLSFAQPYMAPQLWHP